MILAIICVSNMSVKSSGMMKVYLLLLFACSTSKSVCYNMQFLPLALCEVTNGTDTSARLVTTPPAGYLLLPLWPPRFCPFQNMWLCWTDLADRLCFQITWGMWRLSILSHFYLFPETFLRKLLTKKKCVTQTGHVEVHTHTHTCATWSCSHHPCFLTWAGVCADRITHSWRMLLTAHTVHRPPPSSTPRTPPFPPPHTHTHLYLSPAQSPVLSPFVWVAIAAVTLCASFHVKYIVPGLLPPLLPPPLHLQPQPPPPPDSLSLGRCKTIPLFMLPKMPLFQV